MKYVLMDNLYCAQSSLRKVWVDELSEGFGQRDSVPWALGEGYAEEFKVNGRTRLLLTKEGRNYIKAEHKNFTKILADTGI